MKRNVLSFLLLGFSLLSAPLHTTAASGKPTAKMPVPFKVRKVNSTPALPKPINGFTALKPKAHSAPNRVEADGAVLYGDVIYADSWSSYNNPYGIYSISVNSNTSLTSVYTDYTFNSNAGAVYANGLYHLLNANIGSDNVLQSISYYQYDAEEWYETDENEFYDLRFMATDMTVDPLSNTVYGAFNDGNGGLELATFNFTSAGYNPIGSLATHLVAIAADAEGALYGIGLDGILYKVSRQTAELTKIGNTGVRPAQYLQSATFDWLSGKLYWATTLTNDIAGLYEVDTTSGKATLVSLFPDNEEVIGLYSTNRLSAPAAPAAVCNLHANFEGTSTTGTISFTMPSVANDGSSLAGELQYVVKANDVVVAEGEALAGAEVNVADVTLADGGNKIVAYAASDEGKGMPSYVTFWVGYDAPVAPANVAVAYNDGIAHITWTAPLEALHGGWLDRENITYTVTRMPDNVAVASGITATEYSDTFNPEQLAAYYYNVTATSAGMTSPVANSNAFVAGNAVEPPYYQPFDDASTFALLTTIDANEDGTTWEMSAENGYAKIEYADGESDDWLITPQLKLTNDRMWKFSCRINTPWAPNWPEKVGIYFGQGATAAALSNAIIKDTLFTTTDEHVMERYFKVDTDGNYNVGIHAANYELVKIVADSILIEAGPYFAAPAAVTSLVATADAAGLLKSTVSFVAPTKTVDGKTLSALTKIDLYRNGELIHTFDNPAVGEALSFVDAEATEGFNDYKLIATNSVGSGYDASTSVFVGEDIPSAPANINVAVNGTQALLTWTAPVVGANGGYVDTDNLVYGIKDYDGNVLTATAEGTSYTTSVSDQGDQGYMLYAVFAGNSKGYSEAGLSNAIIKGAPYSLPFLESFDNGERKYFWGSIAPDDSYASWGVDNNDGVGGQKGRVQFNGGMPGNEARIFSGKISLQGSVNPVLEFYYWYRAEEGNMPLNVEVISECKDTILVKQLEYTLYMNSKPFELVRVPLSQFKDKEYIQIAFHCKSGDDITSAAIDEVGVRDYFDNDLAVSINAPATAAASDNIAIEAMVKNIGKNTASDYSVILCEGDDVIATIQGESVAADDAKTYTFNVPVGSLKANLDYKVVVAYAADGYTANNESTVASVAVSLPVYPAPTALTATANGSDVELEWTAPDYADFAVPTIDGAETYEAFADANLGDWTTVDADGLNTRANISVDGYPVDIPQKGQPMSFIVMNPVEANAQLVNWFDEPTGWQPATGSQYFASFGSESGANDDWLISPELIGEEQSISFNIHGYYGDEYEVLYSTTGKSVDDFISLSKQTAPVIMWTPVSFLLPEGAKYFAIRNTSYDYPYYVFVDDITFKAAKDKGSLRLSGYNVYRDGKRINAQPLAQPSYTDVEVAAGAHLYQVTAVYTIGESTASAVEFDVATDITSADASGASVVSCYSVNGTRVNASAKGIIIQKLSNGATRKVLVK